MRVKSEVEYQDIRENEWKDTKQTCGTSIEMIIGSLSYYASLHRKPVATEALSHQQALSKRRASDIDSDFPDAH